MTTATQHVDWKSITPEGLQPAVDVIRKRFTKGAIEVARKKEWECHDALHVTVRRATEPAILLQNLEEYAEALVRLANEAFLELANVSEKKLGREPVLWVKEQTQLLLHDQGNLWPWLRNVLSRQGPPRPDGIKQILEAMGASQNDLANASDVADELQHFSLQELYGSSFAVPRFLAMRPLGQDQYKSDSAWTLEPQINSKRILESVYTTFQYILDQALDRSMNDNIVRLAAQKANDDKVTRAPAKVYRSALKRHIKNCLTNDQRASALEVCRYLDEQDVRGIPPTWFKNGNRELSMTYLNDEEVRANIDAMISKVRADLRD